MKSKEFNPQSLLRSIGFTSMDYGSDRIFNYAMKYIVIFAYDENVSNKTKPNSYIYLNFKENETNANPGSNINYDTKEGWLDAFKKMNWEFNL